MEANSRQVGGHHYKAKFEHWDFTVLNGLGYLEGCATKYISRWRKKAGKQDLLKALHYIDKLIELAKLGKVHPPGAPPRWAFWRPRQPLVIRVEDFCQANGLAGYEVPAIAHLTRWRDATDILHARNCVVELLKIDP